MRDSKENTSVSFARLAAALAMLAAAVGIAPVCAQVERSGGGGANAQLMQQFQQAVSERSQLQVENTKLKKDAEDLKKQLAAVQQQVTASKTGAEKSQAAIAAAHASTATIQKSLEETKARMEELVGKFRETITAMRGVETERSELRQKLAASQAAYDQCAVSNESLYKIDNEVLDLYQHQGAFSYMKRSEPFTRIKKTQIDNLSLEYRQRAEELRIKKATAASGANAPAASGAPGTSGKPVATQAVTTSGAPPAKPNTDPPPVTSAPPATAPPK
jgi:chromosome segregation ATPase